MSKEIIWDKITWGEGDDFIAFAFGDFDSKMGGIIRTSDSNRYNNDLSAPMNDLTADIPGGDGQYYFGTFHKPKIFNINFAFDHLTKRQLRELKRAFSGKEMRELSFAEEYSKIYMAKVTSQPNIKALCFDENDEEIYKGEGSVQFTAYWPYARDMAATIYSGTATTDAGGRSIRVENEGDIPTTFVFKAPIGAKVNKIEVIQDTIKLATIEGANITKWDSKTGIIESDGEIISYTGNGLIQIPLDLTEFKIYSSTDASSSTVTIEYYNWYY